MWTRRGLAVKQYLLVNKVENICLSKSGETITYEQWALVMKYEHFFCFDFLLNITKPWKNNLPNNKKIKLCCLLIKLIIIYKIFTRVGRMALIRMNHCSISTFHIIGTRFLQFMCRFHASVEFETRVHHFTRY